jgi:hypothetical protein
MVTGENKMTQFIFGPMKAADVVHLPTSGTLETPGMSAEIEYKIDCGDNDIRLGIDSQYLNPEDIDYLIAFLKAAKEQLK